MFQNCCLHFAVCEVDVRKPSVGRSAGGFLGDRRTITADGWRKEEKNKETNSDDDDDDEGAFLPHSPRLPACSMIGPTFLSGVHSLLLPSLSRSRS